MNGTLIIERSEILESFNDTELSELLDDQFNGLFKEINAVPIDYLKPYYYKYKSMKEDIACTDMKTYLENKYNQICMQFINKIEKVFHIKVSEDWLDEHVKNIPSVALLLYNFFILELGTNMEDAIHRNIKLDKSCLYKLFEERKNKKDGSTQLYSKCKDPEMALLIANIYDVSTQALDDMSEEEYLSYLPEGYVPAEFIKRMFSEGYISGNFMNVIREVYAKSAYLKSVICFNIESSYRE